MGRQRSRELDETLVTSDMHLLHANIIPYCGRPWAEEGVHYTWVPVESHERKPKGRRMKVQWVSKEVKEECARNMTDALTDNWNAVVRPGDTVYHIGDFCLCRWANLTPFELEQNLNGKIVHIVGNHDRMNKVRGLKCAMLEVTGHACFLVHRPVYRVEELPDFCDIVLCGHVHEAWDHKWVGDRLLLNVGVDQRNFHPWRLGDVVGEVERLHSSR